MCCIYLPSFKVLFLFLIIYSCLFLCLGMCSWEQGPLEASDIWYSWSCSYRQKWAAQCSPRTWNQISSPEHYGVLTIELFLSHTLVLFCLSSLMTPGIIPVAVNSWILFCFIFFLRLKCKHTDLRESNMSYMWFSIQKHNRWSLWHLSIEVFMRGLMKNLRH